MSDIFREVEEDVRRERLQKIWKAYGDYIIAAAVLVFAAIAAFELWQRHEDNERAKAAISLTAAQRITNPTQAADAFATVVKTSPRGYALVARLAQANAMAASGQGKNGIELYKQIAKDDDGVIGNVARLRAAWALADGATRTELTELLAPLDKEGSAWRPAAREILAYADYRAFDLKAAQMKFALLANDPQAPQSLRRRADAMAQFIKNGGAASYGTVPPPVIVPPVAATPVAPAK